MEDPDTGPAPIRRRLAEVGAFVEPLAARWAVERGRPRTRTLRRLMQTVELLLRIDEELLLPRVAAGAAAAARPALQAGIDQLRDTLGLMMRGATVRRDAPMAELRRLQAAHRAQVDAWLASAARALDPQDWSRLAADVDARSGTWLATLAAQTAQTARTAGADR